MWRKTSLVIALITLCTTVFAQSSQQQSSKCEEQSTYTRGMPRHVTPAAGPRVADGVNLFLTADFIWWKAWQDGLTLDICHFRCPIKCWNNDHKSWRAAYP